MIPMRKAEGHLPNCHPLTRFTKHPIPWLDVECRIEWTEIRERTVASILLRRMPIVGENAEEQPIPILGPPMGAESLKKTSVHRYAVITCWLTHRVSMSKRAIGQRKPG